ncbi:MULTISPECIES: DUF3137 domain-containing protein [unclassified Lentimicrobium]|uniref:DUF3137 domain-containing protein n=1 Tax=unclassified Lentimicrobium TaxID=2677434 RepID=UPI001556E1E9|nr:MULTISPECIES: DUF3137 domain-containing protein [unclassified Lentimicrobium]NPD44637.1 DUF3137 domain-containing protein [Lentimicrobium sp. S6]NPD83349.1 DUF3137 domain-containing protein [Lentimicrobium sp. L6]
MSIEALLKNGLREQLQHLETNRKSILIFYVIAILLFLSAIIMVVYFFANYQGAEAKEHGGKLILSFVGLVFLGIYIIGFGNKKIPTYKVVYKKDIVEKIAHSINSKWVYDSQAHVAEEVYIDSGLFNRSYEEFYGDDKVSGKVGKVEFESSELKTGSLYNYTDGDGNSKSEWNGVFQGYFFHADFNKQLQGETYVIKGDLEAVADTLRPTSSNKKARRKGSMVALENKEFAKTFLVHSTSQIEARYILTPKLMESLLHVNEVFKLPMHLSFIGEKVYLAIMFSKELFEPSIWKSGLNMKELNKLYQLLNLNKTIIEEMDLNTRIWTKD